MRRRARRALGALSAVPALALAACGSDGRDAGRDGGAEVDPSSVPAAGPTTATRSTAATSPSTAAPPPSTAARLCAGGAPRQVGTVADPGLAELSGLAASRRTPRVLWAVGDSQSAAEVVAIDESGRVLARLAVEGARNVDWEDLAVIGSPDRLVIADTGDNLAERTRVALVVVPEPDVDLAAAEPARLTAVAERWVLHWPDHPRDAEAVLAAPEGEELLLLSKVLFGGAEVARVPADAGPDGPVTLELVGEVRTGLGAVVTGGAVAPDGSAVVLRTYTSLLVYDRPPGGSLLDALAGDPCRPDAPPERQGEAVTVLDGGRGLLTVSEGGDQPVWLVPAG